MRRWIALAFVSVTLPLAAQDAARNGDLILVGQGGVAPQVPCGSVPAATVVSENGSFRFSALLTTNCAPDSVTELLYDPSGLIHVGQFSSVRTYDASLKLVFDWVFEWAAVDNPFDLAMDRHGQLYALRWNGELYALDRAVPRPAPKIRLPVRSGFSTMSMDFGVDGCILYYVERASSQPGDRAIRRYDVCNDTALPDVAVSLTPRFCGYPRLRVAPDGSIFFADCEALYRIQGESVREYNVPGRARSWRGIALSSDGRTLWTVTEDNGTLVKIDVETGATIAGPFGSEGHALAIYGVPRAAAAAGALAIPTLSPLWLGLMAVAASVVALLRLMRT